MSHVFRYPVTTPPAPEQFSPEPEWVQNLNRLEVLNRAWDYEDDFSSDLDRIAATARRVRVEEFA